MGLRNCVDAWGVPVEREGFTRPPLTEPVRHGTNNSPKPVTGTINNSPKPVNSPTPAPVPAPSVPRGRGRPKATDSARPWIAAGLSRSAYYRAAKLVGQYRAVIDKAKDKA